LVHNDLGSCPEEHRRATHWLANGARSFILRKPYEHSFSFSLAAKLPITTTPLFVAGGR
jgi:hypothetical protein